MASSMHSSMKYGWSWEISEASQEGPSFSARARLHCLRIGGQICCAAPLSSWSGSSAMLHKRLSRRQASILLTLVIPLPPRCAIEGRGRALIFIYKLGPVRILVGFEHHRDLALSPGEALYLSCPAHLAERSSSNSRARRRNSCSCCGGRRAERVALSIPSSSSTTNIACLHESKERFLSHRK